MVYGLRNDSGVKAPRDEPTPVATESNKVAPLDLIDDALGKFKPDDITMNEPESERRWAVSDNNFWVAKKTLQKIPSGLYRCGLSESVGPFLSKIKYDIDDLVVLPESQGEYVISEIRKFWKIEREFTKRGFTHKRGVLLFGPPGSGKTSTIQLLIELIVKQHDGLAVFVDSPGAAIACLQMVRRSEPKRHIICLFEDIDALIEKFGEAEYLSLLDGENQIGNIVYVGTTNYFDKLDKRFTDRPSRFDTILEIDYPSAKERRAYLLAKEPDLAENDDIREWVRETKEMSIAHIKEVIILVKCYGHTLDYATNRVKNLRNLKTASNFRSGVGFTRPITRDVDDDDGAMQEAASDDLPNKVGFT
jgi:energy-coupling factor transporter ATP-binding protein EcfA2